MPLSDTTPTLDRFLELAREHTLIPLSRTVAADLETPVGAFLRVAADEPEAFLLESVEGGEKVGRYTFIGIRPFRTLTADRGTLRSTTPAGEAESRSGDVFAELKRVLSSHRPAKLPGLPPFTSGAVGFFAYDVVREIEKLPETTADELRVPQAHLMFFDEVLAFDHVRQSIHLIVTAGARSPLDATAAEAHWSAANARLDELEAMLEAPLPRLPKERHEQPLEIVPRTRPEEFLAAVETTREYIRAGDVFQCVLSQRFDCVPDVDPFAIYRSLRVVNPSPYMYFLRFGLGERRADTGGEAPAAYPVSARAERVAQASGLDAGASTAAGEALAAELKAAPHPPVSERVCHIVGSSPELLVRVKDGRVEYRPIAGTRPRGLDEAADLAHERSLRGDAKEVSEHVMLVDLGRNDLGRVSEYGSVKVRDLMFIERYSHVMHLVSALEGRLRGDLEPLDALRSCFPAGTLSGAPKIRAMEIIEELEPARRGVYGGAIVYADFNGNLDSCIAIRTLFMDGEQGHVQAGAGIVADSVPEKEHEECRNKAAAVFRAIERARKG